MTHVYYLVRSDWELLSDKAIEEHAAHEAEMQIQTDEQLQEAATLLDQVLQPLVETLGSGEIGRVVGYLAVRVEVDADGSVSNVLAVCDTLRADPEDFRGVIGYDEADRPVMEDAVADVRLSTHETLKDLYFEEGDEGRAVVVPFAFE